MAVPKIPMAHSIFRRIHGIFCIYKPPGMDYFEAIKVLKSYLIFELNNLPSNRVERRLLGLALKHNPGEKLSNLRLEHGIAAWRKEQIQRQVLQLAQGQQQLSSSQKFLTDGLKMTEPWKAQEIRSGNQHVAIDTTRDSHPEKKKSSIVEVSTNQNLPSTTKYTVPLKIKDLATTNLVCGPRFVKEHLYLKCADPLEADCSGVMGCQRPASVNYSCRHGSHLENVVVTNPPKQNVLGLGREANLKINALAKNKHLRVYHIKGRLGMATDNHTDTGVVLERSTYYHVEAGLLDKVCTAIQTQYQRLMFENAGVNPESQEAYELASQGLLRPKQGECNMIIYNIKRIYFNPPEFTLEVHSISETAEEFYILIHDIGLKMKTNAVCIAVRRIRYGNFTLQHALVGKMDWRAEKIAENIELCKNFARWRNLLSGHTLRVKTDIVKQYQQQGPTDSVCTTEEQKQDKSYSKLKVEKL